ncbi:VOC family protein [Chitinimonas sp. BJB300]|uniref:VOC family protein n=1 Tax=Chitinimonas sp. BJB300 TaxID=1559339 RepID=UPI000C0CAEE6|nr:hypothetical protein [Chitinimonas sp. BJB300]PHV10098.1 hypothetical protein CSQ89_18085 [Chitinimonas sp. BJB300]TSJ87346.1 hypothetical protein FG002_013985 [Chitinimonas sp. BJB300]
MFVRDGVSYEFHHMGIPTSEIRANERYSAKFGMYTSDSDCQLARIQYHRYEDDSCLHPLIRTVPHPAFKVDDLDLALENQTLLLGPYEPIDGFRVAIIVDGGMPVELIQTKLTDDEIWGCAQLGQQASLYQDTASKNLSKVCCASAIWR